MLKVSVIMTSYNYGRYLDESITSVLDQSFEDLELIIIDDGSKDGSLEILEYYAKSYPDKVRIFTHRFNTNQGIQKSLELGIQNSKGVFLAFCESDDIFNVDNLLLKVAMLEKKNNVSVVYSDIELIGSDVDYKLEYYIRLIQFFGKHFFLKSNHFLFKEFRFNPVATFSNIVVRKEHLSDFIFNNKFELWSDLQLLIHLSKKGRFLYIPEKLIKWRIHKNSSSYDIKYKISNIKKQFYTHFIEKDSINFCKKWDIFFIKVRFALLNPNFLVGKFLLKYFRW